MSIIRIAIIITIILLIDSYSIIIKRILLFAQIDNLLLLKKKTSIDSLPYIHPRINTISKPLHTRLHSPKTHRLLTWEGCLQSHVQVGRCSWIIKISLLRNLLTLNPRYKAKSIIHTTVMTSGRISRKLDLVGSIN